MDGLATFLQMGGYGGFVWSSFGVTVVVMICLLVVTLRTLKKRQATLEELQRTVFLERERRAR